MPGRPGADRPVVAAVTVGRRPLRHIVLDLRLESIKPFLRGNVAVEQYVTDAANALEEIQWLIEHSDGVVGLKSNGAVMQWGEVLDLYTSLSP